MRLRAFDLNEPHALAAIRLFINVCSVESLIIPCLKASLSFKELGKLARPGTFFGFTRWHPELNRRENSSNVDTPNATVTCGRQSRGHDFLFIGLLAALWMRYAIRGAG